MTFIQILLSIIVVYIIYKTFISYKRENLAPLFIIVWLFLWSLILFFILDTRALSLIANNLGIGRGVDLAIYISILVLFYVVYKLLVKIERINKDMTTLVRHLALKDKTNYKKKK